MQEFQLAQSINYDDQKNEFLDQAIQYQVCPNCSRNFFLGKLKYHLKLCKPNNPMTKSPLRKVKRSFIISPLQKQHTIEKQQIVQSPKIKRLQQNIKFRKCQYCRETFPISSFQIHSMKCHQKPAQQIFNSSSNNNDFPNPEIHEIKSKTKIDFSKQKSSVFPRIRNSAKDKKFAQKKYIPTDLKELGHYTVKIRQQLSCFKKALEVQQIQCPHCGRKFSKEASLRHLPICEKLKNQQKHSLVLKKQSKSEIYKFNTPIGKNMKNILFRSKFMTDKQKQQSQFQIRTARCFNSEKKSNVQNNKSKKTQKKSQFKRNHQEIHEQKSVQIDKYIQKQRQKQIIKQKQHQSGIAADQMHMTFSKNFHMNQKVQNNNIEINKVTQQKEEIKNQLLQNGTNNEFLEENVNTNITNSFSQATKEIDNNKINQLPNQPKEHLIQTN